MKNEGEKNARSRVSDRQALFMKQLHYEFNVNVYEIHKKYFGYLTYNCVYGIIKRRYLHLNNKLNFNTKDYET